MIRVTFLIILLLIGCKDRDRSTSEDLNQDLTEQTLNEDDNEIESSVEPEEENVEDQTARTEEGFLSRIKRIVIWATIVVLMIVSLIGIHQLREDYKDKISKLEIKYNYYKSEYNDTLKKLNDANREVDSFKHKLRRERKEKRELEDSISQLQSKSSDTKPVRSFREISEVDIKEQSVDEIVDQPKVDSPDTELFFELPNRQGIFKHENGIKTIAEKRLYKITFQEVESEGIIEFVSSKYDGLAINHKDSMLKPACNIIKENENNPISVNQISPGKVKRVGDEWIIESKIKVEIS